MSLAFGRRPVFIVSTLVLFVATIGSAVQNSYEAHLATRVIQGLATGATESVGQQPPLKHDARTNTNAMTASATDAYRYLFPA